MKDILIFMSDQHSAQIQHHMGDAVVRTPHLDRIAAQGAVFENTYTSCPLCIPARASLLAGQLPSRTSVFDLAGFIPSDQATFLHSLGAQGYETVLCGRMHFEGEDQRHGFTKRIFGDITHLHYGNRGAAKGSMGRMGLTQGEGACLQIIGGGDSQVLEYDRQVVAAALDYLAQPHEKPQCIVVGTYAPHFPYIAPPELYDYYYDKVTIPRSVDGCDYTYSPYREKLVDKSPEIVRAARAAYYGMIEFTDAQIGLVHDAWEGYLRRAGREGVFVYLSDHGDQCGERGLYAKKCLFDACTRIPLIFEGAGIPQGARYENPVSIMDLGPTLCEMTGADVAPEQDGCSLWGQLAGTAEPDPERPVFSEFIEHYRDGSQAAGRSVRVGDWELITFAGYESEDLLFDLRADPEELHNVREENPEVYRRLAAVAREGWDPAAVIHRNDVRMQHLTIQAKWVMQHPIAEPELWQAPASCVQPPEHYVTSKAPMPPMFQKLWDAILAQEAKEKKRAAAQ